MSLYLWCVHLSPNTNFVLLKWLKISLANVMFVLSRLPCQLESLCNTRINILTNIIAKVLNIICCQMSFLFRFYRLHKCRKFQNIHCIFELYISFDMCNLVCYWTFVAFISFKAKTWYSNILNAYDLKTKYYDNLNNSVMTIMS